MTDGQKEKDEAADFEDLSEIPKGKLIAIIQKNVDSRLKPVKDGYLKRLIAWLKKRIPKGPRI